MDEKSPRRGGDFTISAPVTSSAIANNSTMKNVTITPPGGIGAASLDDLRKAVAALRTEVEELGIESAHTEVRSELPKFEEELNKDEPDGDLVRARWTLVQKLLSALPHVASITQITDRIVVLIRTLFTAS